ncbi:hypothetical protein FRB95_013008, partial [Tulasnella sp. JGI-2019a]
MSTPHMQASASMSMTTPGIPTSGSTGIMYTPHGAHQNVHWGYTGSTSFTHGAVPTMQAWQPPLTTLQQNIMQAYQQAAMGGGAGSNNPGHASTGMMGGVRGQQTSIGQAGGSGGQGIPPAVLPTGLGILPGGPTGQGSLPGGPPGGGGGSLGAPFGGQPNMAAPGFYMKHEVKVKQITELKHWEDFEEWVQKVGDL